jgi:PAS domain-containing protein
LSVVDSKLGVDGIEHRRFADGPIVPRTRSGAARSAGTDILGAVANHGTIMHQLRPRLGLRRPPRSSENDRVPQTPLWELADASTLFSAVAAVADALYVVDPEGRIRFLNPAALTILGYKDERQLLGRPSHDTTVGTRPLCLNALAFDSERRNAR